MLRERTGITPREDIHPDLCVALGAGVLASRLGGHDVERVLVDVSPYSFGVSYLGERGGIVYPHCYKPILRRNSPLPITRTERFYTSHPYQEEVNICVYEGEDEDALRDILVGDFQVKGLSPVREQNEVLCRMSLDLDGILHVTAIEKRSGLSKHITIARALESKSQAEIAAARQRLEALYSVGQSDLEDVEEEGEGLEDMVNEDLLEPLPLSLDSRAEKNDWSVAIGEGKQLIERSRQLLAELHEEDREEAIELNAQIESAIDSNDEAALRQAANDLRELLFFVEGRA
jgi:molecular chaperone DnaK (HSP70)